MFSILVTVQVIYCDAGGVSLARTVFSILVTVRLYIVMPEVCHWLTNEKHRKTDIR